MEFKAILAVSLINGDGDDSQDKNSDSVKVDNIFESLVNQHACGDLSDDTFFDEVVKHCASEWDIIKPQNDDSEYESEEASPD